MFDSISVSQRTQKPWTVCVSFAGQMGMIGLAILVPLVGTDALPHRISWISLPEPPRGVQHRAAEQAAPKQTNVVPSQVTPHGLVVPTRVPDKPVTIVDPDSVPTLSEGVGVPGGLGYGDGSGNSVIDGLVGSTISVAAPPPPAVAPKPAPKPITRIKVGGDVQKGKLISGPRPVYPQLARQARISGTVKLTAVISREGTILDLRAVSGHPLLIPAALAAVAQWVFSPTYLNGDPVEVATDIDVIFMLQQ